MTTTAVLAKLETMKITRNFHQIDLHDCFIERVERSGNTITLRIKGGVISEHHPEGNGKCTYLDSGILKFFEVVGESTFTWIDDTSKVPSSCPEFPIDEIMNASFRDGEFLLDGFKETEPWHEWYIKSFRFEVQVISSNEITTDSSC
ncbi:hypothetical protein L4C34_07475 [Vibrio profundum]|uniref:hypothetical protein n=1 Tax=Vibrio profundum TaxID=2910247 RepID=UPI003D0EB301